MAKIPVKCPLCASTNVVYCTDWTATSNDDGSDTGTLEEYQCQNKLAPCYALSFWMPASDDMPGVVSLPHKEKT